MPRAHRAPDETLLPRTVRYLGTVAGTRYFAAGVLTPDRAGRCVTRRTPRRVVLCVMQENGGGSCGISARSLAENGTLQSGLNRAGNAEFVSLVPDGVVSVTVRYGRSTRTFRVHRNFYGFEIAVSPEQFPKAITWHLADGTERRLKGF